MNSMFAGFFLFCGSFFTLIAAYGLVRLPDVYTRMHATAKSGTLGVGCLLTGAAIHFNQTGITTRSILVIIFLFFTIPVATHIIARAAYFSGVSLWKGTVVDEMRDHCNTDEYSLSCSFDDLDNK